MQAYFVGRQTVFIYVHITVDNWRKLERIVTATLGVSIGGDGRAKEGGGDGEGRSFLFSPPPLRYHNFSTSFEIIRAPEENVCNTGYNLRQVTWLLTGYLDRFMSCLPAETPLPPLIDQLERHQKELHYPSHLLNVGNSLGQEALGTVPNFPTALRGSFH